MGFVQSMAIQQPCYHARLPRKVIQSLPGAFCYHNAFVSTGRSGLMLRFSILFVVMLLGLFTLEVLQPVQDAVILPFTAGIAHVSVFLIELFDEGVVSAGKVIRDLDTGFAISIEPGCNGVEALIILFAAIFAFPASLKHKLIGFAIGFVAIQSLNLVRIISLFYLGQWNMTWFNWFHLYLWQALIILDALVVWLIWLRMLPPMKIGGGGDDSGGSRDSDSDDDLVTATT